MPDLDEDPAAPNQAPFDGEVGVTQEGDSETDRADLRQNVEKISVHEPPAEDNREEPEEPFPTQ